MSVSSKIEQLRQILLPMQRVTVAVSGGVDSMTLAWLAHQTLGRGATMVHAQSAAVPEADSQRVADYAARQGWQYRTVHTGEMQRQEYLQNPLNRCYFCKSCLYSTLQALQLGQLLSGTNCDDLGDFRPGLQAATEHQVRHPYVEAGVDKAMVRAIASHLGLEQLAILPASPCLASRVETGTLINPKQLGLINRIETQLRQQLPANNIRCRLSAQQLEIQLDSDVLQQLSATQQQQLCDAARLQAQATGLTLPVTIAPYRRGSAFLQESK